MKKLIFILTLALTGATYVSCSSDDDGGNGNGGGTTEPTLDSITLSADATEVTAGDDITFTVTANYSDATTVDVTDNATLSIDGSAISNPYTTTDAGTFTVEAAYEDATATVDITVNEYVAPTTYFSDDFDDLDASDWTFLDEDGDGYNWSVVQIVDESSNPVGTPVLRSASWNSLDGPLTPDNYAVSPAIDLSEEDGSRTITLSWDVTAADADYADENYTVYVATGNTPADFTASSVSYNELVTDNGPGGLENVYTKTLDVTSFAGETIYVAFRHHVTSDMFTIEVDNVSVIAGASNENGRVANAPSKAQVANVLLKDDLR